MSNYITSNGQTPGTVASLPAVRTFQLDAGAIGNIPSSVNLFRGDVHLPLDLISLPGRDDLSIKVVIVYQSNVHGQVDRRNLEAPTGILSLGWSMPYEMIAVDKKTTASPYDDEYYLVSGEGGTRLHLTGVGKDGSWTFESDPYKAWTINYYPDKEQWAITKENGITHVYGGTQGRPDNDQCIHWGVKWGGRNGNWMDSSIKTDGQERIALAWNLAEIHNPWGESITFEYENDLVPVGAGGLCCTRASYLSRITNICGRTVTFLYQPKRYDEEIKEYLPPHEHLGQTGSDAYQSRYETQYLDKIEVRAPEGALSHSEPGQPLLFSVHFDYELHNVSLENSRDANFYKRYLVGVTQRNPDGSALPGYRMQYHVRQEDREGRTHRGALNGITYPHGGSATFTYHDTSLVGTSHEEVVYCSGIPRVWFGPDYVVVTQYDESASSANLVVSVYRWNGNWVKDEKRISGKLKPESLQVVAQKDFFAMGFTAADSSRLYLFRPQARFPKWDYDNFYINDGADTPLLLAAGTAFVVACSVGSTVHRYVWNSRWKSWDESTAGGPAHALSAFGNYFIRGVYDASTNSCHLHLHCRDQFGQWQDGIDLGAIDNIIAQEENNIPVLHCAMSYGFAAVTAVVKGDGPDFEYEMRLYRWDTDYRVQGPDTYRLSKDEGVPLSVATGSLVANGGHLWRFNGVEWKTTELSHPGSGQVAGFAYGSDLAIVSSPETTEVRAYDPYTDRWVQPEVEGPISHGEYSPSISADYATIGDGIFYRNVRGDLERIGSLPPGAKPESIVNRAPFYIACENAEGNTHVFLLKNGNIVDGSPEVVPERFLPMFAGFNALVTYRGEELGKDAILTLHRLVSEKVSGHSSCFPVTRVTIDDGYQASATHYEYDTSRSTLAANGLVTQYSRVAVTRGTETLDHKPFGWSEHYFVNGLSTESFIEAFDQNCEQVKPIIARVRYMPPLEYPLMNGMLLVRIDRDASGNVVAHDIKTYDVIESRQEMDRSYDVALYGPYVQLTSSENALHCKTVGSEQESGSEWKPVVQKVDYAYDKATGLISRETTYNYNGEGKEEKLTRTHEYGWEQYPALKAKNILTPVVRTTSKTNGVVTAVDVSTWKEWLDNHWSTHRSFKGKHENASFDYWDHQTDPPIEDWLKVSEVIARSDHGVVSDSIDVEGIHTSTSYDETQLYPIARFLNAGLNEAIYTGFENYENLEEVWRLDGGTETLGECIVTGDAHTGISSFKLVGGRILRLQKPLSLVEPRQSYIFSAWVKTESGFDRDEGQAELRLHGNHESVSIAVGDTGGNWRYLHRVIRSEDIGSKEIFLEAQNEKSTRAVLLDDVRFSPLLGRFAATIYDSVYRVPVAQLGNSADTMRFVYDTFQRKVAEIGPQENVKHVATFYLARQSDESQGWKFPKGEPNSALSIKAAQSGLYERFTGGEEWRNAWESETPEAWTVRNGTLIHEGTSDSSIHFTPIKDFSDCSVRLSVQAMEGLEQPLGIGIGSLTAQWTPGDGWSLTVGTTPPINEKSTRGMPRECLLVASNNIVLLYADGRQVFARRVQERISGGLCLSGGYKVAFKDVVICRAPQISITYADGAGNQRQTQALNG